MSTNTATPPPQWHTLTVEQTCAALRTGLTGLTEAEAGQRLARHGFNEIVQERGVSALRLLLSQFASVLTAILMVAIGFSAYLGHTVEAVVIAVIVVLTVLLGFIQEYRAERAIAALRKMAAPNAEVIRDGQPVDVPAHRLVPGDLVRLRAGNRVPADLRLVEAVNLKINESSLTGESAPVDKAADVLPDPGRSLGDRGNMAYAGTMVGYGRGLGIVVATGMDTEFGRIVGLLRATAPGHAAAAEPEPGRQSPSGGGLVHSGGDRGCGP